MNDACEELRLIAKSEFLNKCIQLYDTILVRHGLMLVGEAYSGKSLVMQVLAKAMSALQGKQDGMERVVINKMNPKSITLFQLYGLFD